MMPAAIARGEEQKVAMNSLVDNDEWEEASDCSAEVPSEHDEDSPSQRNAANYKPSFYSEKYKDAASLL